MGRVGPPAASCAGVPVQRGPARRFESAVPTRLFIATPPPIDHSLKGAWLERRDLAFGPNRGCPWQYFENQEAFGGCLVPSPGALLKPFCGIVDASCGNARLQLEARGSNGAAAKRHGAPTARRCNGAASQRRGVVTARLPRVPCSFSFSSLLSPSSRYAPFRISNAAGDAGQGKWRRRAASGSTNARQVIHKLRRAIFEPPDQPARA